jgi:hypothetical protein
VLDGSLGCDIDQTVLLKTTSGWTEVRVVNLPLQKSIDAEESEGQVSETQTRLGLRRLRDLDASEVEAEQLSWADLRALIRPLAPLVRLLTGAAGLIVGASLAFIVLTWTLEQSVPLDRAISGGAPHSRRATEDSRARSVRPHEGKFPRAPEPARPPGHARPRKSIPEEVNSSSPLGFRLKPKDTKLLALSREQLDQLRQIVDEYRTVTESAVLADPGSRAPPVADDPAIQLGRRGLDILTEKQRGSLMRLLARPEFLLKPRITNLLALNGDQLRQLRQIFDAYQTTVDKAVLASPNTPAPPSADDPEIQLGRHGLDILTEKQRGSLIQLLPMTDLLQESNTPNEPST